MKRISLFAVIALAVGITACSSKTIIVKSKTPPPGQEKKSTAPGQVKKETGSQSAKPYAPGQQKKKN